MRFSKRVHGCFLLGFCLALVLTGCDRRDNHKVDDTPAPVITSISPNSGGFGTLVTLSGSDFASSASGNRVKIVAAIQGEMTVTPVSVTSDSLQFIMPSAFSEAAQVSVTANAKQSAALEFTVTGFADPTPDQSASEFNQFFTTLDDALDGINGALANNLEPLMTANGQSAQAQIMHEAMLAVRQGFSQFALDRSASLTSEQMAAYDAFFASEAGLRVLQLFGQVSEKLSSQIQVASAGKVSAQAIGLTGLDSGALEDIREVKEFIRDLRSIMMDLDDALFAAELGLGASTVVFEGAPALIVVLEDIRQTVVKTIIDVLNVVLVILDSVPTDAVGGTLEIELASNNLYLNQDFGSMEEPVSETSNPGHMLVMEPYGLKGTIDFKNGGSQSLNEKIEELVGEISAVAAALLEFADFEIDEIVAEKVEIKLRLVTSQPATFSGSWGSNQLTLTALQPGQGLVTIQGDLEQIVADGEPCPIVELGDISGECIHESDLQVSRTMKAYAGIQDSDPYSQGALLLTAQVEGLAPNQGYIGDTLYVTGEGFSTNPQLAHQDLYFGEPIPEVEGTTGLAWSIHEDKNTFTSLEVEIPDALSGPLNVTIERHPSNALNFTILPPLLEQPPVSAIVGESWPGADGRGFSHSLSRNEGDWNGGRTHPFAPAAPDYSLGNEAAHHHLEFIVPEDAQSGPFKIVTLGHLESEAYDVAVRKFASPIALSALDRPGFRPAVARDSSDGRRIVAWIDHSNAGGNQLVTSVIESSAATFTTPVVVATNLGGLAGAPPKPAVAAANGKLYVAWVGSVADNDEILLASSSDGLTWSAPVNLSNSSDRSSLQPTLSADGELVALAWIEEGADEGDDAALKFRISNNGGVAFGGILSPAGAGDTTDPALMVQGQTIAVAWTAVLPGKRDLFVQRSDNGGTSFSGVWHAANNAAGGIARHPSLAIGDSCVTDGVKSIYLAFENGALEEEVYFARWDGSGTEFTAPLNISNSTAYSRSPVITVDADCIPALAWLEQGLSRDTIIQNGISGDFEALPSTLYFARSFDNGATFNKPVMQLHQNSDGQRLGHLAMIGSEHAYFTLVYQNDSGAVGAAPPHIVLRTTEGEPNAPVAQPAATAIEANQDLIYHGPMGIYVATAEGEHRQKVSRDAGSFSTIGLSPDGRWMAFLPGYDRLIVAEADGAYPMLVASTRDAVLRGGAVWSPDGAYVGVACYWSECSGADKVTAWVKPDSTDFELLFDGSTGQQPWSPSGQMILSGSSVFTKDPATGERNGLTLDPALPAGQQVYYPAWSPDGEHIAFIASTDASINWDEGRFGYGDLYVMNADGSEVRRLAEGGALTPFWSPDNRTIGFVSNRLSGNDHRHVFVMDLNGAPLSEIDLASKVLDYDDVMPFFLPDGSGVVVLRTDSTNDNKKSLVTINIETLSASNYASPSVLMGPGSALHLGSRPIWPDDATATNDTPGATSVGLNWSAASDDQSVAEYQIFNGSELLAVVTDATSYNATGLEPNTTYTLTIIPCDAAGNCALVGQSITFITAADSSGDVTAPVWTEASPTLVREADWYPATYEVYLSWTSATDDSPLTYVLYANGVELARFDANLSSPNGTVKGLRPSTDYLMTVQACDSEDNCTTDGPSYSFSTVADTSELRLNSAQVWVDELTLAYDDPLNDAFVPAPSDFVITVNGTPVAVDSVAIHADDKKAVLTLAGTVYAGDTVLFSYDPGAAQIQDFGANKADPETDHSVYNSATVTSEAIAADSDGNVYVAGYFEGAVKFGTHALSAAGHGDAYIAKRNAAGQWLWAQRAGGTGWDAAYGLALDAEHVYLTGAFTGEGSFGDDTITANGAADLFVAKLDLSGNWIWSTRAGGAPPADEYTGIPGDAFNGMPFVEVANGVAVDGTGNVYLAGKFIGSASFGDSGLSAVSEDSTNIVVAKLNAAGAWQWVASAGSTGNEWANGVAVDGTGVYVTGTSSVNAQFGSDTLLNGGLFVAKLDVDDGAWQWVDQGTSLAGVGYSVVTNGAGEVYVAGNNSAVTMSGYLAQPFVGHWNPAGTLQWMNTATGSYGFASGLTLNADGYLYASGVNAGTLDFGSISISDGGTFIAKIATDGAWQWALAGGGNDSKGIASCGASGQVCATGTFSNSATFGALPTIYSPGSIYLVKAGNTADAEPVGEWRSLGSTAD